MITDQQARVSCDRGPICEPFFVWYAGTETDYDAVEKALKDAGWVVTDTGEHICPVCVPEYEWEMRQSASEDGAEHESRCMDRAEARAINAGRY